LLTSDPKITKEVEHMFEFFEKNYKVYNFKHLIFRHTLPQKADKADWNEMEFAKAGKKAEIFLKMNSLVDEDMINHLYDASKAALISE